MHEHWLEIKGYEGLYWVSDQGNLRSGKVPLMHPDHDRFGYQRIRLQNKCAIKRFLVHQLVMETFVGPRLHGMTINHKNGKKGDNRLANLEYMTQGENEQHSFDVLGRMSPGGSKHWNHKLTEVDVIAIIEARKTSPLKNVAEQFNVSQATISMIVNRRTWRRVATP